MKQILTPRNLFIAVSVILAGLTRLLDHPFNFTAIGAIALFGGAAFSDRRLAFLVPVLTMLATDLVLGFHDTMIYVYVSFILITVLGMFVSRAQNVFTITGASVFSSLLFFLITNFGVWMSGTLYSFDLQGLIQCYVAGLAFIDHSFFGNLALNTLMGDLFFNGLLFGSLYLASLRFPRLARS